MVPADDEHESANEAERNTSTKEREPGHLTPMPNWLMKWWIPIPLTLFLLALGCFLASIWHMPLRPVSWQESKLFWPPSWPINPFWPPSWPFNYHWPSKDAMALCTTIAGAGFAFATWQQRSHDNAAKAKQAQAAIERDDYWKRREHIYQLLGSENPGLRLSAVALLAELADSASHSNLLNKTEKQQLQRHIINMLCLQLRHEGLNIPSEGTEDDHSEIQRETLNIILDRMDSNQKQNNRADWTKQPLFLRQCEIHTPVTINNRRVECTLDLSDTTFHKEVSILNSDLLALIWESATFEEPLLVSSSSQNIIAANTIPQALNFTQFTNIHIVTTIPRFIINFPNTPKESNVIRFENCSFFQKVDSHSQTQPPTTDGGAIITGSS